MGFIIGRSFLLSYRQGAADHETRKFPGEGSQGRAIESEQLLLRWSRSLFPVLPRLVFLGLRGELNGNRGMGDQLGGVCRKLDQQLVSPLGTFQELGTGDGGNL